MDPTNPFANLSPEALQQLIGLGGLNQQDDLLQQQLAMAQQIRNRPSARGYGVAGGIGAGLENLTSGIVGGLERKSALEQLHQNQALEDAGRKMYGVDLARGQNPSYGMAAPMPAAQPNRLDSSMAGMVGQPDPMALAQARVALLRNRPPPMLVRDGDADGGTDDGY